MLGALAVMAGFTAVSCDDEPDKFKLTDGTPEIYYIRPASIEGADSLIVAGYLDNNICIVGENLTSIKEIYFNDQQAIINTSYVTPNTMVIAIPGGIPEVVTNKIYMVNKSGVTTDYDFSVLVPVGAQHLVRVGQAGRRSHHPGRLLHRRPQRAPDHHV